jgi:hypothetical protein
MKWATSIDPGAYAPIFMLTPASQAMKESRVNPVHLLTVGRRFLQARKITEPAKFLIVNRLTYFL